MYVSVDFCPNRKVCDIIEMNCLGTFFTRTELKSPPYRLFVTYNKIVDEIVFFIEFIIFLCIYFKHFIKLFVFSYIAKKVHFINIFLQGFFGITNFS